MKIVASSPGPNLRAFTLPEIMIVAAIFSFLVAGMISVQLFGMRVYTLAATKLTATADSRETMNAMRDSIRSANLIMVGTVSNGAFAQIPTGLPQAGSALAIQYTNAFVTNYLVFYRDLSSPSNTLCCLTNGVSTILAKFVTNSVVFDAEDYQGNILTNYQNNPVIRITLQFYQWEYPIALIGTNSVNAYNFYQLRTRIARREK